ncbi:FAD-binding oxidoreductase [sulfur-oxidizing endosymbiont of Gigantopelta aegis]|uniref:FAD-binding oxidoreductase n=1 Tax=sulfur-oxidizing endosymbiont of Gigantopelta aegis TaxID=2794934 RepID=UPI0018DB223D|nr:FAD-binding oxidoreductase [sulfur-oxidizing endosymbiont of Gigantopelta aegis]
MSDNFTQAIQKFKELLGSDAVITEQTIRNNYETATYQTDNKVLAIVKPASREQVQQCLRIANEFHLPLYPVSTGLNVGYGSKVPSANNCIILELKRMNNIVDFNAELAHITIEPGVTQAQLYQFLQADKSNLWMDATGSFTHHSLIGNIAERGFGHTPYGDHFAQVGGMEVVLANGNCIHTGFGRFPNAKARGVYKWGVGPYIDGLFTQSNFGIITQITLWLMPAPEYSQTFYFSVKKHEQLAEVVNLLRPLRLNGTINSAMHIANDYKVLQSIGSYPWDKTEHKTPLSKAHLKELSKTWDFGAWNASGALYGSKAQVALARKLIKKQLKGKVKKLRFIDDRLLKFAEAIQKPYQWLTGINLSEMLKIIKPVVGLTKGVPTNAMIPSTYWRKTRHNAKETTRKNTPEQDACGLMWLSPVAPTDGQYALEIWSMVEAVFSKYQFEPAVSITLITERTMDCVVALSYDREIEGEDRRAQQCHDELFKQLTDAGYYPYRLGIHSMQGLPEPEADYQQFIASIKQAIDANGILSPGHYDS